MIVKLFEGVDYEQMERELNDWIEAQEAQPSPNQSFKIVDLKYSTCVDPDLKLKFNSILIVYTEAK